VIVNKQDMAIHGNSVANSAARQMAWRAHWPTTPILLAKEHAGDPKAGGTERAY
jgi:hypothetical protein